MKIDLIGVPLDFGAGRRGVDMGPSAIRYAGLCQGLEALGHQVHDTGNVPVPVNETVAEGNPRLKYLEPIVNVCRDLAERVDCSISAGHMPVVLGGDHSLGLGSVMGAARGRKLGLLWIDAHADFNTDETTPSGNIHGMPLSALCGIGTPALLTLNGADHDRAKINPRNVAVIGARDLDDPEKVLLREAGVSVFSIEAIDRYGIHEIMTRAIRIASRDTDGIYLSLDLDSVDPRYAPGVGTPVPGGLTFREAHLAVELAAESGRMVGMDVVEVNPILDERNTTAQLAVRLALSALGKRVWDGDWE
jgi:arginase